MKLNGYQIICETGIFGSRHYRNRKKIWDSLPTAKKIMYWNKELRRFIVRANYARKYKKDMDTKQPLSFMKRQEYLTTLWENIKECKHMIHSLQQGVRDVAMPWNFEYSKENTQQ